MGSHRHSHVVPAGYLRQFGSGRQIGCVFRDGRRQVIGIRDAGVRREFYAGTLANGERSRWLEYAMQRVESRALPVLQEVPSRWPLLATDRVALTELMALQIVRSPRWRGQLDAFVEDRLAGQAAGGDSEERVDATRAYLNDYRERCKMLLGTLEKLCGAIGDMRWALFEASRPRLVTSDHPVVLVSVAADGAVTTSALPEEGFVNVAEIRLAVSPRHLLVLTWKPGHDPTERSRLPPHAIRIANAAVVSQAEEHWFHLPGTDPRPVPTGSVAVSYGHDQDYGRVEFQLSERRRTSIRNVNEALRAGPDPTGSFSWSAVGEQAA